MFIATTKIPYLTHYFTVFLNFVFIGFSVS